MHEAREVRSTAGEPLFEGRDGPLQSPLPQVDLAADPACVGQIEAPGGLPGDPDGLLGV